MTPLLTKAVAPLTPGRAERDKCLGPCTIRSHNMEAARKPGLSEPEKGEEEESEQKSE